MSDLSEVWRIEKCKICGKTFIPTYKYLYKLKDRNQKTIYYCSYTCWKKDGGDNGNRNIHGVGRNPKM